MASIPETEDQILAHTLVHTLFGDSLGGTYYNMLAAHDVDFEVLEDMESQDLRDIDFTLGVAVKILHAVKTFREDLPDLVRKQRIKVEEQQLQRAANSGSKSQHSNTNSKYSAIDQQTDAMNAETLVCCCVCCCFLFLPVLSFHKHFFFLLRRIIPMFI